jgi:hypothetical protein
VDISNYENPFASNKKEIGQMDVEIDDESILRESIRTIILEVSDFQCNNHSLGWVDDKGNWLDTEGADHQDYLWANVYNMEDNRPGGYPMPAGWIKVSNANQVFFGGNSWDDVTKEQIDGLIKMWNGCSKFSRWIQTQTETKKVLFGIVPCVGMEDNYDQPAEWMTIPEFLAIYGGRDSIDYFYGMLLGEL